jgi:hypothetical protein
MSDFVRSLIAAALFVLPPQFAKAEATDCLALPADFMFCAKGTDWAAAEVIEFSGGVALEMGALWLEIGTATDAINAAQPFGDSLDELADLLADQARNEGLPPPETLAREVFETEHAQFATLTTRLELPDDDPMLFVSIIAGAKDDRASGQERLLLSLDSGIATSLDGLAPQIRNLANLIRPQEG